MTSLQTTLLAAAFWLPAQTAADKPVDYLREVKPILAAHCYSCHGAIKQKGGLRLDTVAHMKEGGDHGAAFESGKVEQSLLLKHVLGGPEHRRMPPEQDGEALKATQIAILKHWIEQGAAAPKLDPPETDPRDHWAFRTPIRPAVPKVKNTAWVRNAVDAFIAETHEKDGLSPQPPADKGLLLRRVYLDLIGLPPTREELQAFLSDNSPNAYEKVVDRLLASPQYGERWGRHWMDIWRYSDWWGLGAELRNSQRHIWHWRDWIVESLNKDKGYDRMLLEMLAADELYPTDENALRGTGFLARHYFKFNRTTWLDETIEHTGKAFLGITLNCCKCHDHKYDPFSQVDYYRFRAIFEPYQIRTDNVPGQIDLDKNGVPRVYDAHLDAVTYLHVRGNELTPNKNRKITPGLPDLLLPKGLDIRSIMLPSEAHQPALRPFVLQDHVRIAEKQLTAGREELTNAQMLLARVQKTKQDAKIALPPSQAKELARDDFSNLNKELWEPLGGDWKIAKGKLHQQKTGNVRGSLRLRQTPPMDFEARFKLAILGGQQYHSVGITFDVDKENEALIYLTDHQNPRVQVSYKKAGAHQYPPDGAKSHKVALNQIHELVLRVRDGLLNVSVDGQAPLVYRLPIARRAGSLELITFDASARFEEFVLTTLPADVKLVDGGKNVAPLNESQARIAVTLAEKKFAHAEAMIAALKARAAADRAVVDSPNVETTKQTIRAAALAEKKQALAQAEWNLVRAEAGQSDPKMTPPQAKAAVDAARKALANPGEVYTPLTGALKTLESNLETEASRRKPFPRESSGRRAALAQWVADAKNPLTARVAVNHIWARHFGQPLVATVFDFGRKGAAPTHPALLDWLAVELMEKNWSTKHLHRLLVMSNTYRMTSSSLGTSDHNTKSDPDNRRYWRMNTLRMESQVVRDSLLHLAGELDLTPGGPTVEIPQQDASKRRSLYFFHSAIDRNKFLTTFDEADPLDCYHRRESIIPQQALALANSKLAVSMADKMAGRLEQALGTPTHKEFAREAFAWILGYAPSANELAACEQALNRWSELNKARPAAEAVRRGRMQLILALLNHNDFITIR